MPTTNQIVDTANGLSFSAELTQDGLVRVHGDDGALIAQGRFQRLSKINATNLLMLIRSNGQVDFYDRQLRFKFTKRSPTCARPFVNRAKSSFSTLN